MTARSRIVDSICVLVGVGLVLSVLDDSFTPRSAYLVAGLVPAAVLLGLALLLRSREGGGGVFCLLAAVLYAPLAAVVALHDPGPYLMPTPEAMARALGASVSGPLELVSTLPPVGGRPVASSSGSVSVCVCPAFTFCSMRFSRSSR